MTRAAFIGLGAMGLPMACNLARAGVEVVGFDPRAERVESLVQAGGHGARSAQEAATSADVALTIPLNAEQVRDALFGPDGVLDGLPSGATVLVMSTIGPPAMRDIAAKVQERGMRVIDAPVTGGAQGATA